MAIKFSIEQQLAIDSRNQNIIVSAGAGSGKTAVLTERIRQILLSGVRADELLVLTFTNAAASEMKSRIVNAMAKDDVLKYRTTEVDSAYITTFDSFSLSLVSKYHDRLNLTENISIIDNSILNVSKRKIINDIFNELYESHNEKFEKMIGDLTVKDDSSIKKCILNIANKINQISNKDEILNNYVNNNFNDCKISEYIDEIVSILKSKIEFIKENIEKLQDELNEKQYNSMVEAFTMLINSKNYNDIATYSDIKKPRLVKISQNATTYKNNIYSALETIVKCCCYKNEDEIKETYFQSKVYVEIVIEILKEYYKRLNEYKNTYEVFEFIDISKMAIDLVKNNLGIREEMKRKFKEILVDEYQDTNDLQEEFISYIANNNVYMVGDIKQSIYGFRNANPLIFKNKYDAYKNHFGGMKIDLNQNFRSNRAVLHTINQIFNKIMDDEIGQANFKKEHQMRFGLLDYDKGSNENKIKYVTYLKSKEYEDSDVNMFYILKDIKEKINKGELVYDKDARIFRACEYKDFAILAADSTSFEKISKLLSYNHIPNLVFKNVSVSDTITTLLKNIIKLIVLDFNGTYDDEFLRLFYGVGRSFIIQMSDEQLFDLITNENYKETNFYDKIHYFIDKIYVKSMVEIYDEILEKFDVFKKLIRIGEIDNNITRIEFLRKTLVSMERIELTIFDFVKYIDDIYESGDNMEFASSGLNENKVKIMTIHKSKGLEFPIVYFVGNYKMFVKSDVKDKFVYDNKYGLIAPYFINGEGKTINLHLLKFHYNRSLISEEIRLLYVALTRAREQMIIINAHGSDELESDFSLEFIPLITKEAYSSFETIYNSVISVFTDCKYELDVSSLNISDDYLKPFYADPKDFIEKNDKNIKLINNRIASLLKENAHASKETLSLQNIDAIKAMKYGSRIHEILETIYFINPDFSKMTGKEKGLVSKFLNSELMQNVKNGKVYKEFEFIYDVDDKQIHGIIDLMVIYNDYIDIIDYKLSHIDDEEYIKQLQTYQKYIENKLKKPTKLYLYSILKNEIKEVKKQ